VWNLESSTSVSIVTVPLYLILEANWTHARMLLRRSNEINEL